MSFRELRNFTEIMRALGYPRLVSVDNFRKPHFALVADILYWMATRYDPNAHIPDDIDTENERVLFVTKVAELFAAKAGIKLKTRRLYAADGKAVKELLKIAELLYSALRSNNATTGMDDDDSFLEGDAALNNKIADLKNANKLGSEITEKGAKLYDLLLNEKELRDSRDKALRLLDSLSNGHNDDDSKALKKKLRDLVKNANENVLAMEKQVRDLEADCKSLQTKIKKRRTDLERNQKRLKSLQTVRPAFMDEYEKLERELQRLYEIYLERFRNLDYMEHELDGYNRIENEKLSLEKRELDRLKKKIKSHEDRLLYGENDIGEDDFNQRPMERPSAAPGNRGGNLSREGGNNFGRRNVKGSIIDGSDSESEPSGLSGTDSDSDRSLSGSRSLGSESGDLIDDDDQSISGDDFSGDGNGNFKSSDSDDDF